MSTPDLTTRFLENAAKVSAGTHNVKTVDVFRDVLSQLVPVGVPTFCPRKTDLEQEAALCINRLDRDYRTAQITIEEVSAAIAETGSIVCQSKDGRAVQASLLPPHHIALVLRKNIFATLDDFFAAHAESPPTNMTIITGPSRTADIELNLVIGVHGPERLDIIVV